MNSADVDQKNGRQNGKSEDFSESSPKVVAILSNLAKQDLYRNLLNLEDKSELEKQVRTSVVKQMQYIRCKATHEKTTGLWVTRVFDETGEMLFRLFVFTSIGADKKLRVDTLPIVESIQDTLEKLRPFAEHHIDEPGIGFWNRNIEEDVANARVVTFLERTLEKRLKISIPKDFQYLSSRNDVTLFSVQSPEGKKTLVWSTPCGVLKHPISPISGDWAYFRGTHTMRSARDLLRDPFGVVVSGPEVDWSDPSLAKKIARKSLSRGLDLEA